MMTIMSFLADFFGAGAYAAGSGAAGDFPPALGAAFGADVAMYFPLLHGQDSLSAKRNIRDASNRRRKVTHICLFACVSSFGAYDRQFRSKPVQTDSAFSGSHFKLPERPRKRRFSPRLIN